MSKKGRDEFVGHVEHRFIPINVLGTTARCCIRVGDHIKVDGVEGAHEVTSIGINRQPKNKARPGDDFGFKAGTLIASSIPYGAGIWRVGKP